MEITLNEFLNEFLESGRTDISLNVNSINNLLRILKKEKTSFFIFDNSGGNCFDIVHCLHQSTVDVYEKSVPKQYHIAKYVKGKGELINPHHFLVREILRKKRLEKIKNKYIGQTLMTLDNEECTILDITEQLYFQISLNDKNEMVPHYYLNINENDLDS